MVLFLELILELPSTSCQICLFFFQALDANASNVLCSVAALTYITARVLASVKFQACDDTGIQCVTTLQNVYHVPQQQHNLGAACQRTHSVEVSWESLDFERCTWRKLEGMLFPCGCTTNQFVWCLEAIAEFGERKADRVAVTNSLVTTRS